MCRAGDHVRGARGSRPDGPAHGRGGCERAGARGRCLGPPTETGRLLGAAQYAAAGAKLDRIERRSRKLVDAIADGVPARTRRDEFASLEAREDELNDLVISETAPQLFIHANLPEAYRQKVADLHVALQEEATGDEAMALIRSLVDETVHSPEEGKLRIDLEGKLARILRLCAGSKNPVPVRAPGSWGT